MKKVKFVGRRIRHNPKSRILSEREHISLERRADEEPHKVEKKFSLYAPQPALNAPQQKYPVGINKDRFTECIAAYAASMFGYSPRQTNDLMEELDHTDLPQNLVSGILFYFHKDLAPAGYTVVKDPHMGQAIFVENNAIEYLVKHLGKDMDLSTPEGALAIWDNPNIIKAELFLGMAAVATLDKTISGRPFNDIKDPYTERYGKKFPKDEHYITKTLESAFEHQTKGRGKDI